MTIPSSDQMDHIKQRTAALGAALCDVRSRQSRTTMLAVTLERLLADTGISAAELAKEQERRATVQRLPWA